ncbi:MAG: hypothetical protein GX974_01940 [Clostridiales bacterium]|nr:hypothetical protein [Clostridiales bacterium]
MLRVTAPGRAGIIGNPTDGYGGSMITCSVKKRSEVIIEKHPELVIENAFGTTTLKWKNDFENKDDYFDIVRSILRFLKLYDLKAKIRVNTNIPVQAGLAGSTAILSSVLSALLAFTGKKYNRYELAEINRVIELHYMKCQCGYQDAYSTTFGGLNYLDFRGKEYYRELDEEIYATVEPLSPFIEGDLPFIIAHTGIKHHSGDFHRPLRERWVDGEKLVVDGYSEIAHMAREGKKAIINGDWEELGYLMNKNHEVQDSISDSGEQNNFMIKAAKNHGALAGKLAGAGGGGTIIVLTLDPERTIKGLKEAGAEEFIELDPFSSGATVAKVETGEDYVAATDM